MDEMKIRSGLLRNVIAKVIQGRIEKAVGYETTIRLGEIGACITDETAHIHLDIDAEISRNDLIKLLTKLGLA